MSEHAPGPWSSRYEYGVSEVLDSAGQVVAIVYPGDGPRDGNPNVPLIEAAPLMLAAAKDALAAMDDCDEFGPSDAWGDPEAHAKREALRDAIAKAERAA